MEATDLAVEQDTKQQRARRSRPLPAMARRVADLSAEFHQVALREEARNLADHERVRAICNAVFGGGLSRMLKASPMLTEDDKDFLKELKYI